MGQYKAFGSSSTNAASETYVTNHEDISKWYCNVLVEEVKCDSVTDTYTIIGKALRNFNKVQLKHIKILETE